MDTETETDVDTVELNPVGCSIFPQTCESRNGIEPGYHCVAGETLCAKCPIGTYGADGKTCLQCPFGTWTIRAGETKCYSSFSYSKVGLHKSTIPFGVNQITVSLWGGGGGGEFSPKNDEFVAHAGGGGGYLSCNVVVSNVRDIYIVVGDGGKAKSSHVNPGGRFYNSEAFH
jgi:hypothetical protein